MVKYDEEQAPALEVIGKLLRLYRYFRRYSREMHRAGLRGREVATLRYLLESEPLTIGQIAEYLFISASTASEMVSRMEGAGHVARRRSKKDCRVVYVELTPGGRQLAEEMPLGGIPLFREKIKALSPERLEAYDRCFSDLLEYMEVGE
jgi:DNA-binding MarR family transcriptional regulator